MASATSPFPRTRHWHAWLDPSAGFKYQGIYQAIANDIASGRLQPGDALPPQRALAKALGVDLTTVTKAYGMARAEGLIETRTGSGTSVAGEPTNQAPGAPLANKLDLSKNSPPRASGPDINALIVSEIARAFAQGGDNGRFNYQETGGNLRHRAAGATWLERRLGEVATERLILTSGAQSALFAICFLLSRHSKKLAVGEFCYPGIHTIARQLDLQLVPLGMDQGGIIPEDFEQACEQYTLGALYLVPTLDNPTTATLTEARREQLVTIARRHAVPIIEDDPYYDIAGDGNTALARLAPELTWHIATLSKCATPALRLAYLVAPDSERAAQVAASVQAMTMMVSPLFAELASQWIETDTLKNVTQAIRVENQARLQIAHTVFAELEFRTPHQGSHIWLPLPNTWHALDFVHHAERQHIQILPAASFSSIPGRPSVEAVRISLGAAQDLSTLEQGLRQLRTILAHPPLLQQAIV